MFNQHCSLEMQKHAVSLALLGTECAVVLRLHLLISYRQHLIVTTVDISNLVNPLFYKVRPRWRRKAPQEACCTPPPSCAGWQAPWPEVNISPKINISSRPLKMALHGTPGTPCPWCPWIVIFLHGPKKKAIFLHMVVIFLHGPKKNAFFMHNWKRNSLNLHCIT